MKPLIQLRNIRKSYQLDGFDLEILKGIDLEINAGEYFPITNLDNYTFNHSILEVIQNEGVKNYRLSVTATPNELIEQYYALAKAMGMSVEAIDYSGNSILQLLHTFIILPH